MAFYEKAGPRQVDFDFAFPEISLSFLTGGCSERPERSRARSLRRQRTRFLFRSVRVGCSRFSRCYHLFVDLCFHLAMELGQAINAVNGTRRWGAVLRINESETMRLPAIAPVCCCAVVRKPLRSPTSDAARSRYAWIHMWRLLDVYVASCAAYVEIIRPASPVLTGKDLIGFRKLVSRRNRRFNPNAEVIPPTDEVRRVRSLAIVSLIPVRLRVLEIRLRL